jgi:hypothetical protein
MTNFQASKILDALENETNASIMELTTSIIKKQKNDMLQKLQLHKDKLKEFHKKLKKYRYCSDLKDLQMGFYIRWIPLKRLDNIKLTNGGIICEVVITEKGIYIVCKNNRNKIFQFKFEESLVFQKISNEENVILKVMDYLDNNKL